MAVGWDSEKLQVWRFGALALVALSFLLSSLFSGRRVRPKTAAGSEKLSGVQVGQEVGQEDGAGSAIVQIRADTSAALCSLR